jgi:hypothetical protein
VGAFRLEGQTLMVQDVQDAQERESFILSILVFGVNFGGRGGGLLEVMRTRIYRKIRILRGVGFICCGDYRLS